MATQDDVRAIVAQLPGTVEGSDRFGFSVQVRGKAKGIVWSWAERIHPKKARVINDSVLAIVTPNLAAKDMLIDSDPAKFFTEPHYNGYPAVLVRLEAVSVDELEDLIVEAWRSKAPADLLKQLDERE